MLVMPPKGLVAFSVDEGHDVVVLVVATSHHHAVASDVLVRQRGSDGVRVRAQGESHTKEGRKRSLTSVDVDVTTAQLLGVAKNVAAVGGGSFAK